MLLALGLVACAASTPFPVDKRFGGPAPYGDGRHPGIDYGVHTGTPVIAVAGGKVVNVRPASDGIENGLEVSVVHDQHFYSFYAHLDRVFVEKGQPVKRGQLLGLSGESNNYSKRGNQHLHFGICQIGVSCRRSSDALDPGQFWFGGETRCFDPKASYSGVTNRELTGPIACGEHAEDLKGQVKGRP
jgi:murein DD-endopeptidase MepM/ murein hydrolase activator NlpD